MTQAAGAGTSEGRGIRGMKRDHAGFAIALLSLLVAPQLPVGYLLDLPDKSGVSLGFLGLSIWAMLSPRNFVKIKLGRAWLPSILIVSFGIYCLILSAASASSASILYAAQYAFYVVAGHILIGGYVSRSYRTDQTDAVLRIVSAVGFVFSAGVIVSVFTGPFYPQQVAAYSRHWGEMRIQQGVGFSEGTNAAGAILIVLNSISCFALRATGIEATLSRMTGVAALLATISRGSILGFCVGIAALVIVQGVRLIMRSKVRPQMIFRTSITLLLAVSLFAGGSWLLSTYAPNTMEAISFGFGFAGVAITESESSRIEYWQAGLDTWWAQHPLRAVLGNGFRSSQSVSDLGVWLTSHNLYINLLQDCGLVGLAMVVMALAIPCVRAATDVLRSGGAPVSKAALVAIAGIAALNMTEVFLYSPILTCLVLLVLALQGCATNHQRQPKLSRHVSES